MKNLQVCHLRAKLSDNKELKYQTWLHFLSVILKSFCPFKEDLRDNPKLKGVEYMINVFKIVNASHL